jgi:CrcB protein
VAFKKNGRVSLRFVACDQGANDVSSTKWKEKTGGIKVLKYFYIAIGGALGSLARFWVDTVVAARLGTRFPYGTFLVNMSACLLIGFSLTFLTRRIDLNPEWRFLVPIGFLGAYSTFSSYEWEIFSTLRSGHLSVAALYAVGSIVLGVVAVGCGVLLGEVIS